MLEDNITMSGGNKTVKSFIYSPIHATYRDFTIMLQITIDEIRNSYNTYTKKENISTLDFKGLSSSLSSLRVFPPLPRENSGG